MRHTQPPVSRQSPLGNLLPWAEQHGLAVIVVSVNQLRPQVEAFDDRIAIRLDPEPFQPLEETVVLTKWSENVEGRFLQFVSNALEHRPAHKETPGPRRSHRNQGFSVQTIPIPHQVDD